MELYVIRHVEAEGRRPDREDAKRRLTDRGRERLKEEVAGLRALEIRFDRLYHSPWRRAVETADGLMKLVDGERVETKALATAPRQALLDELAGRTVAVVGHEPWLSELIAWLVTGDALAGRRFEMKKGAVAWLSGPARPGRMMLGALYPPKALRRIR
jgi:phosphohistidine phosphatase